ncbi:pentatricopeptide repeat-containing protein At3g16610 [Cynara cardunculus var. scolymus]|uniref:pentatricopeptide repeat-containing protein At3g16610 n=1 Tax=Cynara cardunculus var. scolymus TaxID=59895 RepID=UPI000D628DE5|nr:pentatricopeptide repeat-containing protein At3g16610 [Cynara cardunculus var. scolymus]
MAAAAASRTSITNTTFYLQILENSIKLRSLTNAKTIHQHFIKNNLKYSSVVLDKLTRVYISFHQLELAHRVFDNIPYPERKNNVLLWNQLIRAYAWEGPFDHAITLYVEMMQSGATANKYTYPFVLKACSAIGDVEFGKLIHDRVKSVFLGDDVYICTALVDFYVKCGLLGEARKVFDKMPNRDVVAWNAMIAGSSLHGMYHEMIDLVQEMQKVGLRPNSSTIVAILPAIGEANELMQGKAVHGFCLRRRFDGDVVVGTGLLDMYAKCECLENARRVFDTINVKNDVTWSAMIAACVACDSTMEALELFDQLMVKNGANMSPVIVATVLRACANLTDINRGRWIHGYSIKLGFVSYIMVGNTLLSLYAKCGIIDDAIRFFNQMDLEDTVSFNSIISGCVQNGHARVAFNLFHDMRSFGINPDMETMMGFFAACSHLAALQHGACGHSYSVVQGFTESTKVCNAIIDMYSKCGKIEMGRLVFDQMHKRDSVSWNAMIFGYGIHGLGLVAVSLFEHMQTVGFNPDDVTFVCLLSACSHSRLVADGKHWYAAMTHKFQINPRLEHYLCMVDLLGRAGLLSEAYEFILRMPFKPDVRIWSALLGACRIHKNVKLGEEISSKIQILGPESTGNFVLLSNIYSTAKRWDDAARTRVLQRDKGFKKSPGCSWVEINGIVHTFVGGDRSHPQWPLINTRLDKLLTAMKNLGYDGDYNFVLQDVEEEEKEHILLYHSEKLAVALGDLSLSPEKPILVTKNLRVCVDCHTALKYMSTITKRMITVRDTIRFHHFKNGTCNCGDFW